MPILVYVTPWNPEGYTRTLTHAVNLTHVSPTWHAIRPLRAIQSFELITQTERNLTWLTALASPPTHGDSLLSSASTQEIQSRPKVVPRVVLEPDAWSQNDYVDLVHGQHGPMGRAFSQVLVAGCQAFGYDGFVLELTPLLDHIRPLLMQTAAAFRAHHLDLILVAPPAPLPHDPLAPRLPPGLDPRLLASFHASDANPEGSNVAISLMTYDYSSHRGVVGPNAPLAWVEFNLNRLCPSKSCSPAVLLGLNFYGMRAAYTDRSSSRSAGSPASFEPILGRDLPHRRTSATSVVWDKNASEHIMTVSGTPSTTIWYPSRRSIRARVRLCKERNGCGVAVWEGGQGTDQLWEALFSL